MSVDNGTLRRQVRRRLCEWDHEIELTAVGYNPFKMRSTDALMQLFRFEGAYHQFQIYHENTPEIHAQLEALLGPHGYALYKAMKIKGGASNDT